MPNLNRIIAAGHLGKDPEMTYTTNGTAVCNASLAVTSKWKTGEHTEWFRVTAFAQQAEYLAKYGKKGDAWLVEGEIRTEKWKSKEGEDRYTTKLIAQRVMSLTAKSQAADDTHEEDVPF